MLFSEPAASEGKMRGKIADTIILKVGHGILTIPRRPEADAKRSPQASGKIREDSSAGRKRRPAN